jgi:hypothetical protein
MVADILTKPLDREKFLSAEKILELRRHIMTGLDLEGDKSLFTIFFDTSLCFLVGSQLLWSPTLESRVTI